MSNFILGLGISLILIGTVVLFSYGEKALDEMKTDEFESHDVLESPLILSFLGLISIISGIGIVAKAYQIHQLRKVS